MAKATKAKKEVEGVAGEDHVESKSGMNTPDNVKPAGTHIVANSFRDIQNFDKQYNKGDDVSHFDSERLSRLVESGLVEKK